MRLAFCNATRRWGGVKTWTLEFAAALQRRGHEAVIYGREGDFLERARRMGLAAFAVPFGMDYNPLAVLRFAAEFRRRGTEAVLVNVGKDLRTAGFAARLLGLPLVQRIGLPGDRENSWSVRLDHHLLRPHYLCPCRYIRDGLLRNLPFIRPEQTDVIYSAKEPLAVPPEKVGSPLRLLSSSQVNANKGHAELAHTLAALRRQGLAFHWEVAGTGDCLDALRDLCTRLGLADCVTFHGFTQDLGALLRRCDIFVLSSYTEGLPNTLLEALAFGLAPVARDVGGVAECMPPALTPYLVPVRGGERKRDWAAAPIADLPLYAPLRRLLEAGPEEVLRCRRLAWEHCRDHFSLPVQAAALEVFFQRRIAASRLC